MAIFAYELGDLMAQHALELSLMSAMSTVGHNGTHVAASTQPSLPNTQDFETTTGTCRYSLPHNEHGGSVEVVAGSETSAPAGSGQGGGEYSSSALREHSIASTTAGVESSSPECVSGLASRMHAHSPMGRAAAGVGHVPSGGTVNGTGLSDEEVLRSQLLQMYLPQSKK